MKIHEYQAKKILKKYKIEIPIGDVAFNKNQALEIAKKINLPVVIKAQIHAGGRGKSGGVKIASSIKEVEAISKKMIGSILITPQTKSMGQKVRKILIEKKQNISNELYISILVNRNTSKNMIIASNFGGIDIENIAKKDSNKIITVEIDPIIGIQNHQCREIIFGINIHQTLQKKFFQMLHNLYKMFIKSDCSLLEINPLVLTTDNNIVALDAKIEIDSNSIYRQKEIIKFRDTKEEDTLEIEAFKHNLNFINLENDGNIGNMVNGAGLAMATMDMIKQAGAEPANFLDVGGGATSEMIENGLKIILSNKKVKGIFINIFGGILRCDILAKGVVNAIIKSKVNIPVIVRMEGTNVEKGRKIFMESNLKLVNAKNLKEAAKLIAKID